MEDQKIIELFWQRDERAIMETQQKYQRYLMKIAWQIVENREDCQECINDAYLKTWNSILPQRPQRFAAYLGKIVRQTAIDLWRKKYSLKRGASQYCVSLSELQEIVGNEDSPQQYLEVKLLAEQINHYLHSISKEARVVFLCRYFFNDSMRDIAAYTHMTESKVKTLLFRARKGLKNYLAMEGYKI